ncbi:hypothetical protein RHSIM_Rhsim09G0178700 [Rhododendron simsii]|uniref:Uncharacterized protein n=1 Tax=Rhododendron simsii TaxID=118357 RepID=A0A834GHH9_RHOSS|nr:hypothetical protein RHSIM_Rhsim09G0178700 [Rhododendron simsii]
MPSSPVPQPSVFLFSPLSSAFRVVWPAGGALAGGLRFSLDPGPSGFPDLQVSVRRRRRLVSGCGAAWGGCNNSGVVVCPPWLQSCVGLSTVTLSWPELCVPAGVYSLKWCPSTEENSFEFLLRGLAGD